MKEVVKQMFEDGQAHRSISDLLFNLYEEIKGHEFLEGSFNNEISFHEFVRGVCESNIIAIRESEMDKV